MPYLDPNVNARILVGIFIMLAATLQSQEDYSLAMQFYHVETLLMAIYLKVAEIERGPKRKQVWTNLSDRCFQDLQQCYEAWQENQQESESHQVAISQKKKEFFKKINHLKKQLDAIHNLTNEWVLKHKVVSVLCLAENKLLSLLRKLPEYDSMLSIHLSKVLQGSQKRLKVLEGPLSIYKKESQKIDDNYGIPIKL